MLKIVDMASGQDLASATPEVKLNRAPVCTNRELELRLLSVAESEEQRPNPRPRPWFTLA